MIIIVFHTAGGSGAHGDLHADLDYAAGWKPPRFGVPMLHSDPSQRHDIWVSRDYKLALQYYDQLDEATFGEVY